MGVKIHPEVQVEASGSKARFQNLSKRPVCVILGLIILVAVTLALTLTLPRGSSSEKSGPNGEIQKYIL